MTTRVIAQASARMVRRLGVCATVLFIAAAGLLANPAHSAPKEAIGIHGYWKIDVRDPDGSLVNHVEFENGLCLGPVGGLGFPLGGDSALAVVLSGVSTTGGWEVWLGSPAVPAAPVGPACPLSPVVFLLEQSNDFLSVNGSCEVALGCFPTLNPPLLDPATSEFFTLAGQFTVPGSGSTTITAVGTAVYICFGIASKACVAGSGGGGGAQVTQFTGAYLTGIAPLPPPLTVVGGQSVSVNVQISFH
jgi:hypothetical protein